MLVLLRLQVRGQTGQRVDRRRNGPLPFGGLLGPCWAIFSQIFVFFPHFWVVFTRVGFFHKFFVIFARFLMVWGGFLEDFERIFRRFFELSWKNAIL